MHAVEPSILSLPPSTQSFVEHRARARLHLAAAPLLDHGLEVHVDARSGRAWEVLRERCAEHAPDIVVVGSRGLSAMQRAFLGSNADRLLRTLAVPVLVVHEGLEPPERLHALVATDFSQDSAESVQALVRLFGRSRLRLHATVLHVAAPPQVVDYADIPIAPSVDWSGVEEAARRGIDECARPLAAIGVDVHPVVLRGSPARAILAEARDMHADLVVLGRRPSGAVERWLLGSTAERVLHGAHCAVLTAEAARVPTHARRAEVAIVT
jgi:nucleotide-binding universal stress UspA family protein